MVGTTGIEPPAPASRRQCSPAGLRDKPYNQAILLCIDCGFEVFLDKKIYSRCGGIVTSLSAYSCLQSSYHRN